MDLVQGIVLGLVQGLVEWLPLSSQAQVIAVSVAVFGSAPIDALNYSIFLHIGTLVAAAAYFRREIFGIAKAAVPALMQNQKTKPAKPETARLLVFMVIALLATAITAIPTYLFLKQTFTNATAGFVLLSMGVLLIATGAVQMVTKKTREAKTTKTNALIAGLGQGFSVLPGISRSGTTTSILLFEGFRVEEALRLSFILSVPSVFAAEIMFGIAEQGAVAVDAGILAALATAAIAGFASISILMRVAKKINFAWFCFLFGAVYVVMGLL
ncbi:MAG: undecaprenyl-diphosphate phosphatase [Candidatus Diapherotrites archaeon]